MSHRDPQRYRFLTGSLGLDGTMARGARQAQQEGQGTFPCVAGDDAVPIGTGYSDVERLQLSVTAIQDTGVTSMDWHEKITKIAKGWLFGDVPVGALPGTMVLPLENPDLHDRNGFVRHLKERTDYSCVSIGTFNGARIGVLTSKFGAPAVAMTLGVAGSAGVHCVIGVGCCGGLRSNIACGDLVVPHACVRDEGTSERYVTPGYPAVASLGLMERLRSMVGAPEPPPHTGVIWSTDAILRETTERVEHWSRMGCIGVDMESSALYTVGRLHGIETLSLLTASDNPTRECATDPEQLSRGSDRAIMVALKLASDHASRPRSPRPG